MAEVIWTEPALRDVKDIIDYIAKDSLAYAARFGTRLVAAPRRLETFPKCGRIVPEFQEERIRELICDAYRLIYLVAEDACFITAVVHASRQWLQTLEPGDWLVP